MSIRFELPAARTTERTAAGISDITEQRPCAFPVVYGFVRLPGSRQARRNALEAALHRFCQDHELTLGGTFIEYGGGQTARSAAFAGLLAALGVPNMYGVVIPSVAHLGRRGIAAERRQQIERIGIRLLFMRGSRKRSRISNEP